MQSENVEKVIIKTYSFRFFLIVFQGSVSNLLIFKSFIAETRVLGYFDYELIRKAE